MEFNVAFPALAESHLTRTNQHEITGELNQSWQKAQEKNLRLDLTTFKHWTLLRVKKKKNVYW